MSVSNHASPLESILTPTDHLGVDDSGNLLIEKCRARTLVERFGSPLYVISEQTIRENIRRIRRAFEERWPGKLEILYAIKANNNYSVRAIAYQEGAGGDCFGEGELYATFMGGADPNNIVLNGTSKSYELLRTAVQLGVRVNIDAEDEIGYLREITSDLGRQAYVNLRVKVAPPEIDECEIDFGGPELSLADWIRGCQWGLSVDLVSQLIPKVQATPGLVLKGYHMHIGRASNEPRYFATCASAVVDALQELYDRTGFEPSILNMGGGYPRHRDGESGTLEINPHGIDEYADAVTRTLLEGLKHGGFPIPELWIEPGRYIVGNAGVLLGTVGAVKRDLGKTWVNMDFSVNNLMRVDTNGWRYQLVAADRVFDAHDEIVDIVGPLCLGNPIGADRAMPHLERGDLVAALDAGMYAEVASTQMNGVPRPATVLVNGTEPDIIKERETVLNVFSHHRILPRLRTADSQD